MVFFAEKKEPTTPLAASVATTVAYDATCVASATLAVSTTTAAASFSVTNSFTTDRRLGAQPSPAPTSSLRRLLL